MFILLNCSKKIDGFNLYTNCLLPLFRNRDLSFVDLSREFENEQVNFDAIKVSVESCLTNAKISKYSLIILYDIESMKKNPILFSPTAIINNFKLQVIDKIKVNYIVDSTYMVLLDDAERDYDGQIIDENIKRNLEFDKKGYIDGKNDSNTWTTILTKEEFSELDIEFDKIFKNFGATKKLKDEQTILNTYCKSCFDKIKTTVLNNEKNATINEQWYFRTLHKVLDSYLDELDRKSVV